MTPQKNALDAPTPSPDQVPGEVLEQVYDEYLKIANGQQDPWHRTELRNSAYAVKQAITALEQHLKGVG